jgi:acetoin utilization deacetylase AcuC-like enzyme
VSVVGFYDHPLFREHDSGTGHPERPQRLEAVRQGLRSSGLGKRLRAVDPRPATEAELLRVHTPAHVARVAATRGRTVRFDADTQAGPHSYEAALLAAGAVVDAVDRVLDGKLDRAFCAVRPPGHHAPPDRVMGFCLFNNVAVAAAHALHRGLSRVLIVDYDVHHGNGTQDIFYDDPRVLYVSSHAYPFYPGTGALAEVGEGKGRGFTVNLPLPDGLGDEEYVWLYERVVVPIGRAFAPELVLVSAGFDAHRGDPLAGMDLTHRGYGALTAICTGLASAAGEGRTIVALEGGYLLPAIAASTAAVVGELFGGGDTAPLTEPGEGMKRLTAAYRDQFAPLWPGAFPS